MRLRSLWPLAVLIPFLTACHGKATPNNGNEDKEEPDPTPKTVVFAKGADLGWITEMEAKGCKAGDHYGYPQTGQTIGAESELSVTHKSI